MPLPSTVRVKLSSEAAEAITLTRGVVQELAMRDLLEHILGVTGKDEARIGELLLRGALVSGTSRFPWQGWGADPDSSQTFLAANCERALLRGGRHVIELAREAAVRKGFFQRESFWDALMRVAGAGASRYDGDFYREHCDRFVRDLEHAEAEQIRAAAKSVKYSTLRDLIRATGFTQVELLMKR